MDYMFIGASAFNQNLKKWCLFISTEPKSFSHGSPHRKQTQMGHVPIQLIHNC